MKPRIVLYNGVEYDVAKLSKVGLETFVSLKFVEGRCQEAERKLAVLNHARSQYVRELKDDIIESRTGIKLSDLLAD
jgi:hypothetical protein